MINVTKTYLPPFERYQQFVKTAYDAGWITNNGKLVQDLEARLKDYLEAANLFFMSNGTITLQIAIKALKLKGAIITTPFSYVATTNAILWENCTPVFADILPDTFCIDPDKIEESINSDTVAILATHVYGLPCDIERIEQIAGKHNLKVIYDAAHAFGATYKGQSLLTFGDVSSCSFHATKIFHTVEGGCLVTNDEALARDIYLARQFGHVYDDYFSVGINAKNSEFHAAMGLSILPDIPEIIANRKQIFECYNAHLSGSSLRLISIPESLVPNYAYYPIVFPNEERLLKAIELLKSEDIIPRRYFYPSLNQLPFIPYQPCPISESLSSTVLCLPLFYGLSLSDVEKICSIVLRSL